MLLVSKYKGEVNFAVSNIIQSVSTMVMGVVAAASIDPKEFGIYQSLILVATYATFLHFGTFNGLNRNLAFYKAQGKITKMQETIDTSFTVAKVNSVIGIFIGVLILLFLIFKGYSSFYIYSGCFLCVSLVLTPLTTYLSCTYRSGQEFGKLGSLKNIQSLIFCIFSLLPFLLGLVGKIIADMINCIVGYCLLNRNPPYPAKGKGSIESLKDLLSVGFPLLIGGYLWQIFVITDRTFIATHLSSEDMGLYSIAGYCMSLFMILPIAMNTLLYPKAASRYGETGDKRTLITFWWKSLALFSVVLIPLVIVAYFILPVAVHFFLPKYIGGIETARISLLSCLTFIYMGPSVIFGTLKKNIGYIIIITFCLIGFWTITYFFKDYFTTIESVAYLRFAFSLLLMIYSIVHTYLLINF